MKSIVSIITMTSNTVSETVDGIITVIRLAGLASAMGLSEVTATGFV